MLHGAVQGGKLLGFAKEPQGGAVCLRVGVQAEDFQAPPVAAQHQGHVPEEPVDGGHPFSVAQGRRDGLALFPGFRVFVVGEVKQLVRIRGDDEAVSRVAWEHGDGFAVQTVRQVMESGGDKFPFMEKGTGFFQCHQQEARPLVRFIDCGKYFAFSRVCISHAGYSARNVAVFRHGVEWAGFRSGLGGAVGVHLAVDIETGMNGNDAHLAGFRGDRVG